MSSTTVLRLQGITKRFGSLVANDAISRSLRAGEVLRSNQLASPLMVKRGDQVLMVARHEGIEVSMAVEALDADVRARFEALRAWRRDRASEQHVPPYVIFHDKALLQIAQDEPGTLDALSAIPGVGQSKIERYGAGVLEVLRNHG